MKDTMKDFKAFILRGNVVDLAIAVVIGAAFNSVIKSMVDNIIMPLVGAYLLPSQSNWQNWSFGPAEHPVLIGKFLSDTLNFLIIAFAVFIVLVKFLSTLRKHVWEEKAVEAPKTKECPACTSAIPIAASRCAFCTADVAAAS